ncbi:MAG: hypothetical protein B1H05_03000, partial [Candidatus Cloacimonas sp. 4484_140]
MKKNRLSYSEKTIIFVGALTIFKLIYTIGLNVIPDEAYYYLWGKNLALSYFDHPPMIGYLFAFLSLFFKSVEFVVHLQPILLGAGTSLYAYFLGKEMFNEQIGFTFLVLSNMTLLLFAGTIIATPDTPMIFFLTAGIFHFYRACRNGKWIQWILAGVFLGCALLSKYVAVLIFPALLLFLIFTPERKWLKSIKPYITLVISFIVFLPVIIWNAQHEWLSFSFQFKHGIGGSFPNWQKFGDFLGGQAGIVGPLLFVLFIIALIKILAEWKYHSKEAKLLFFIALVFFGFFLISSMQKKVEANWAAFASLIIDDYPDLIPAANRHQIASELIIYSKHDFVCFDLGNRPHQFTLWRNDEALIGKDFLLFDHSKKLYPIVINSFENVEFITSIPRFRGMKLLQVVMVYRAENFLGDK